jgi:hypothetical protein
MLDKVSIFKSKIRKVNKSHECFMCHAKINKGDNAEHVSYRYDGRLISIYHCMSCVNNEKVQPTTGNDYVSNYDIILELLVALLFFKPTLLPYKRWFEILMSTSVWASIITFILYMTGCLF